MSVLLDISRSSPRPLDLENEIESRFHFKNLARTINLFPSEIY